MDGARSTAVLRTCAGAICRFTRARNRFCQPHPDRPDVSARDGRLRLSRRARRATGRTKMNERAMNEDIASDVLERYSKVAVIRAGVIGASLTAGLLAHGCSVLVNYLSYA